MAANGLLTVLAVILSLYGARGFVPNGALNFFLDGPGTTHKKMTENAIVEVTADLLRDNPNPDPTVDSTSKINALSAPSPASLIEAYYGSRQRVSTYKNAIDDIAEANSGVDFDESKFPEAHFDSEQFQTGQNRLIKLNRMMINEIKLCRFRSARKLAGRALHTLQDFYSHSNWVEMGRSDPYSVLGKQGQRPENVAPRTMRTCTDCARTEIGTFKSILFALGLRKTEYSYMCSNNILDEINRKRVLTSGYYDVDNGGSKPAGKCSHGGWRDSTSDRSATGGINKDSLDSSWSPHHYYHRQAVAVATQASVDMLQDIRSQVEDDTKFAAFLGLSLEVSAMQSMQPPADAVEVETSISYVIDTTGSMREELPEIQRAIPRIRIELSRYVQSLGENVRVRFILVPFNDPGEFNPWLGTYNHVEMCIVDNKIHAIETSVFELDIIHEVDSLYSHDMHDYILQL